MRWGSARGAAAYPTAAAPLAPVPNPPDPMADADEPLHLATIAVHGGRRATPADPDVAPPLRRSTAFLQHPETHAATDAGDWTSPLVYARYRSPNVEDAEQVLARLEGAEDAALLASGMAAIHGAYGAMLPAAEGVVLVASQIYGGTTALLEGVMAGLGVAAVPFDLADLDGLRRALDERATPGALVHVEGISNPVVQVADLRRIADVTHGAGARLLVDSTFATPVVQRPLELGADAVVHSATKALAGHSDVTAGAVLGRAELVAEVKRVRRVAGAILDPAAAWLLRRSLSTVDLRVRAQCAGAMALARALADHPAVTAVHYPGLPGDPSHGLAREVLQPELFGSVLAFELAAGDGPMRELVAHLSLAIDAPSLGGVETLVSLPAHMSHALMTPDQRAAAGVRPGCVRVAVGIEDPRDLVRDFLRALDRIS